MSDHPWVTGTHTYNGITGRMALHQTTYVPRRRCLRRQNILFFLSSKAFRNHSDALWRPSVFSCHRDALKPSNRVGHYWSRGRKMDSECDTDGSWERKNVSILPATRHRPRTQSNSGVALVSYTLTAAVPSEVSSGQHTTVSHSFISLSKTAWQTTPSLSPPWMDVLASWATHRSSLI